MRFNIELSGEHAEDSAQGFRGLCDRFVTALRDAGYTVTGRACDWDTDELTAGKPGEEASITVVLADRPSEEAEDAYYESLGQRPDDWNAEVVRQAVGEVIGLAGIDFASDNAAELAADLGLVASNFDGLTPSGKGGYTVRDVKAVAVSVAAE